MADALDIEQPSVGGEADLLQGGEVVDEFVDVEVLGLVDRRLGPQRSSLLEVLCVAGLNVN